MKAAFTRFKKAPDGTWRALPATPSNFDVIEVPREGNARADVLKYVAQKLALTVEQLEITERGSNWQIRKSRFIEW